MNPNTGETTPGFELDQPREGQERQRERAMEQKPAITEPGPSQKQPKTLVPEPTIPMPVPATTVAQPATPAAAGSAKTDDLSAHEADVIEKQWVTRAKAIVNQTQDDPYVQKKEISKAGADYIKKRFNKTIPTDDAAKA